jgi:hypothetical protein
VEEEVGTIMVDGTGVDKITGVVIAGFADSGVDADSVANKSAVGVGADVPKLQAGSASKSPIQIKSRLSILFLN